MEDTREEAVQISRNAEIASRRFVPEGCTIVIVVLNGPHVAVTANTRDSLVVARTLQSALFGPEHMDHPAPSARKEVRKGRI